ncbi:MAG: heme o synthase [Proteobacteria bacterium]|nr:heme o synthase [Pseudomonadota bacterium]
MSVETTGVAQGIAQPAGGEVADYVALLKPRVMSLVVFSGITGLVIAPGALHPLLAGVAILCIALGAGASGALNMWFERDIDALLGRTRNRPLPAGRLAPESALQFGVALAVGSVALMGVAVNWIAAAVLAFTIGFYLLVYTMWLKRRTPQNIVIGGAAGALPPVVGWVAATGEITLEPLILFAIIFLWTPPHFWALALFRAGDYSRAGVPMLPVVAGPRATKRQMLLYTLALLPVALLPSMIGMAGVIYGVGAGLLGVTFVFSAVRVLGDKADRSAKRMFGFSILYLFGLLSLLIVDHYVGSFL